MAIYHPFKSLIPYKKIAELFLEFAKSFCIPLFIILYSHFHTLKSFSKNRFTKCTMTASYLYVYACLMHVRLSVSTQEPLKLETRHFACTVCNSRPSKPYLTLIRELK